MSEITLNKDVRKGLRILIESIDLDSMPSLNLTEHGQMCVREAMEWIETKAYQGELEGVYSGSNYDPYGAW